MIPFTSVLNFTVYTSFGGRGPEAVEAMIEKSFPWMRTRVPIVEDASTGSRVVKW